LRFPDWASKEGTRIALNGEHVEASWDGSYITVSRHWRPGDRLQVSSSMPVLVLRPHWRVDAVRDCCCSPTGAPLVHCLEADDLGEGAVIEDVVLDGARPASRRPTTCPPASKAMSKWLSTPGEDRLTAPDRQLYAAEDESSLKHQTLTPDFRSVFRPRQQGFQPLCGSGSRPPLWQGHWVEGPVKTSTRERFFRDSTAPRHRMGD